MAKAKIRDYFEPWRAEARRVDLGEPVTEGLEPEQADRAIDSHRRARENAGWVVWGNRMAQPGVSTSLMGETKLCDSQGIVVVVRQFVKPEDCELKPQHLAERIAACVTACRGVADPASTLNEVRGLLLDLCNGSADRDDPRVLGCLGRMGGGDG